MKLLQGKTALVTGGRQGIGRAIVDNFAESGATVLTCGRGSRPDNLPQEILWKTADISSAENCEELKSEVENQFGALSILVNNAGIQIEKDIVHTTDEDWESLMGVNAKGVFMMCRELIPLMETGGSIINIGSIAATVADHGLGLYNASKGFIHGLTRSIAVDHGPDVRCNAIAPGWIMTEMADIAFELANDPKAAKADALARHPIGRFGQPQDVAKLAAWLASEESSFATGQCYTLDGGLTAGSALNPKLF